MKTPYKERPHPAGFGGIQRLYRFSNGFGASVIKSSFTYGGDRGLWELAVIKYENKDSANYDLTYETPITNDVEGYLTEDDVDKLLKKIEKLDENQKS